MTDTDVLKLLYIFFPQSIDVLLVRGVPSKIYYSNELADKVGPALTLLGIENKNTTWIQGRTVVFSWLDAEVTF